jgi:hypothetical protein
VAQQYPERDFIDVMVARVLRVPWWASLSAAAVSFVGFRALANALVPSERMNTANSGHVLTQELLSAIALAGEIIVPLVLLIASVLSLKHRINAARRKRYAERVARRGRPARTARSARRTLH